MRFIITLVLISLFFTVSAQGPALINYQGVARDASLTPLSSQAIALKFEILQGSASGPVIYTENQLTGITTNSLGLFTTQIGKNASLAQVNWQNGPYYLQVSMDATGGSNLLVIGTQQMVSVPFALHAEMVPSTYTNNILTIGSQTHAINSGTAITVSQGTGTNISVTGGPNYTVSYIPPAAPVLSLTSNNASIAIVGSNTIALPASITPTLYPSGIASVTNGAYAYTVGVDAPVYNNQTGVLSFGANTALVTPTLVLNNGVLYSGPFTNSVSIPSAVTVAGSGIANVSGGPNYLVNVPTPSLAMSANNLSISIVGSNSVALPSAVTVAGTGSIVSVTGGPTNYVVGVPAPVYTGTALILGTTTTNIAPTLNFTGGILTSGASSNSVNLSNIGPWTQAGTSVTLSTATDNVAIGTNAASSKLEVYSNAAIGGIIKATSANAANTTPAVEVSSSGSKGLFVTNTSASGIGGDFTSTSGYALFAQNNSNLNSTIYSNNTGNAAAGYFKGGITVESKLSGFALNAKSSTALDIFSIRNDGFVSVGSSAFVAKLDVDGNLRLNGGKLFLGSVGGVDNGYTGLHLIGSNLVFSVFKTGGGSVFGSQSIDAVTIESPTGEVGIGTSSPGAKLDVAGNVKITDGTEANGKILTSDATGLAAWKSSPAAISFGNLNGGNVVVGSTATNLITSSAMTFVKQYAATEVEINLYSNAYSGSFAGGTTGVDFEIYVDGAPGTASVGHHFFVTGETKYISLQGYFSGLSAGSHTINIIAYTNTAGGTSTSVLLDPGGYGGKVLVKETF